jgi:hypothetical protein
VEKGAVDVTPYDLELDYDYWSYGMPNRLQHSLGFLKLTVT